MTLSCGASETPHTSGVSEMEPPLYGGSIEVGPLKCQSLGSQDWGVCQGGELPAVWSDEAWGATHPRHSRHGRPSGSVSGTGGAGQIGMQRLPRGPERACPAGPEPKDGLNTQSRELRGGILNAVLAPRRPPQGRPSETQCRAGWGAPRPSHQRVVELPALERLLVVGPGRGGHAAVGVEQDAHAAHHQQHQHHEQAEHEGEHCALLRIQARAHRGPRRRRQGLRRQRPRRAHGSHRRAPCGGGDPPGEPGMRLRPPSRASSASPPPAAAAAAPLTVPDPIPRPRLGPRATPMPGPPDRRHQHAGTQLWPCAQVGARRAGKGSRPGPGRTQQGPALGKASTHCGCSSSLDLDRLPEQPPAPTPTLAPATPAPEKTLQTPELLFCSSVLFFPNLGLTHRMEEHC
nr:translation initiation factor IF-2-like [Macaca fascicularis]